MHLSVKLKTSFQQNLTNVYSNRTDRLSKGQTKNNVTESMSGMGAFIIFGELQSLLLTLVLLSDFL